MTKKTCYNCAHKRNVAGDCHISCSNPDIAKHSQTLSMLSLVSPSQLAGFCNSTLGFAVEEHGIRSGWFMFPMNYDPNWMSGECFYHSENEKLKNELIGKLKDFIDTKIKKYIHNRDPLSIFEEEKELLLMISKSTDSIKVCDENEFNLKMDIMNKKWEDLEKNLYKVC